MILCNGCSKSGTHFLTSLMLSMGKTQLGGTLIKRPKKPLNVTSKKPLSSIFEADDTQFIHSHLIHRAPLAEKLQGHKHLFIIRHPRNIAISWMRHRNKQDAAIVESAETLEMIIRGGFFGHPVPDFIGYHLPWREEPGVCCIRFEDLVARDEDSLTRIAQTVGATPDPEHYTRAFGDSSTWTGKVSDWSDSPFWTEAVEKAWGEAGGPEIEKTAGYA